MDVCKCPRKDRETLASLYDSVVCALKKMDKESRLTFGIMLIDYLKDDIETAKPNANGNGVKKKREVYRSKKDRTLFGEIQRVSFREPMKKLEE